MIECFLSATQHFEVLWSQIIAILVCLLAAKFAKTFDFSSNFHSDDQFGFRVKHAVQIAGLAAVFEGVDFQCVTKNSSFSLQFRPMFLVCLGREET